MLLEDYFDFLSQNEIRLKGHRIGIEDVLYEHIYNELTPAELAPLFDTRQRVTPEQYALAGAAWAAFRAPNPRRIEALLESDDAIVNTGHVLYQKHCAVCHGGDAAGGAADALVATVKTADLTTLAKDNDGVFPFWELYEIISGSELLPAHGGRTMPLWHAELARAPGVDEADAASVVRGRILAIMAYLSTVQVD